MYPAKEIVIIFWLYMPKKNKLKFGNQISIKSSELNTSILILRYTCIHAHCDRTTDTSTGSGNTDF